MRGCAQRAGGLPYDYASACVPVGAGAGPFGVLSVLWPAAEEGVSARARRRLAAVAAELADGLSKL
ncbi:hypothetical protein VM98_36405, partial [Streptomyces rubellomurinus subsp. indigoferus]